MMRVRVILMMKSQQDLCCRVPGAGHQGGEGKQVTVISLHPPLLLHDIDLDLCTFMSHVSIHCSQNLLLTQH